MFLHVAWSKAPEIALPSPKETCNTQANWTNNTMPKCAKVIFQCVHSSSNDWTKYQSSQIILQCTNTCLYTLSLTHPLQHTHSECNAYKSVNNKSMWSHNFNRVIRNDQVQTKTEDTIDKFIKISMCKNYTRRLKRCGGSRFLLFSRERTRTMCAWIAHETQWWTFAYNLGRTYPVQMNILREIFKVTYN